MRSERRATLSRYFYDALDRMVTIHNNAQATFERFYCGDFLVAEIQGEEDCSLFRVSETLLAQHKKIAGELDVSLFCADRQDSILKFFSKQIFSSRTYTPYGYHSSMDEHHVSLGFIGEYRDPVTGCYILGNGYRAFNPTLMRFNSPDSLSPFKEGGLNAYAYCKGDPINFQDNNGHLFAASLARVLNQGIKPIKTFSSLSVAVDKAFDFSRKAFPIPPPGYRLVGYHGSKSKHIENLASNGLDSSFMGRNLKMDYGPGFYASPSLSVARGYAKPSQRFNGFGFKKSNSVGAVFVKDLDGHVANGNLKYIPRHGTEQEQIVFHPHMYKDVLVMPLNSFKGVKRPEVDLGRVRRS